MAQIGAENRITNRITLFLLGVTAGGFAFFFLMPMAQPFPPIIGRAVAIDGDTIDVGGKRVRMQGIDAPERAQECADSAGELWPCGQAATAALRELILGAQVTCEIDPRDPTDRYGRTLGWCSVSGAALSTRMVRGVRSL